MRKDLGKQTFIFPMPVLIIGTYDENGEADAMNAAWGGIYDYEQIFVSLSGHVTTDNIRKNKAFTISFATKKTVAASDYVGLVSKADVKDKIQKAGLHPYKSSKVNAPLFEEYPLTLECELVSLDGEMGEGGILVGKIVNVSADESILSNGKVDIHKLEPIAYNGATHTYNLVGEEVAKAFQVGMKLK